MTLVSVMSLDGVPRDEDAPRLALTRADAPGGQGAHAALRFDISYDAPGSAVRAMLTLSQTDGAAPNVHADVHYAPVPAHA
jgi:hypothetical protein